MDRDSGHVPVLRDEVIELLGPPGRAVLMDCTVGLGGHAEAMLEAAGEQALLVGTDVDEGNLRRAQQRLERFGQRARLFQANFDQAAEVLNQAGVPCVDALVADLGVASTQLDDPSRGLSFQSEGPLDMRLDPRISRTAADIVNHTSEAPLADLIYELGEERFSRRIARAIVAARKAGPIATTTQLAQIVSAAVPAPARATRRGVHPATRTFQALRIAVNDELGALDRLLDMLPKILALGGRAAVISFHSLEDRRVKQFFASWAATGTAQILSRKPITAGEAELAANPRSRSAKLRGIERLV